MQEGELVINRKRKAGEITGDGTELDVKRKQYTLEDVEIEPPTKKRKVSGPTETSKEEQLVPQSVQPEPKPQKKQRKQHLEAQLEIPESEDRVAVPIISSARTRIRAACSCAICLKAFSRGQEVMVQGYTKGVILQRNLVCGTIMFDVDIDGNVERLNHSCISLVELKE